MTISTETLQRVLDGGHLFGWEPAVIKELITARAKIEAAEKLAEAVRDFATAKIAALRYQPAYGESPEDEPDPVVEADYVWALQADAKAALAAWESLK